MSKADKLDRLWQDALDRTHDMCKPTVFENCVAV